MVQVNSMTFCQAMIDFDFYANFYNIRFPILFKIQDKLIFITID